MFVDAAEVVVHEMKGYSVTAILNFLAESVRKSRETTHSHTHCKILPFNIASGNVLRVGIAGDGGSAASDARQSAMGGRHEDAGTRRRTRPRCRRADEVCVQERKVSVDGFETEGWRFRDPHACTLSRTSIHRSRFASMYRHYSGYKTKI